MCDIQDMVWIMHTNHWAMEWAEANPDLQNKGGGGGGGVNHTPPPPPPPPPHPDPEKRGVQAP